MSLFFAPGTAGTAHSLVNQARMVETMGAGQSAKLLNFSGKWKLLKFADLQADCSLELGPAAQVRELS